jgi:hypothetical protein
LTSAIPQLHPYTLELCLAVLALITVVNLRGTLEAGLVFSVPTYLFVISLGGVLLFGVIKTLVAGGSPVPVVPPPPLPAVTGTVTLWLLLRAFASGCTAMTGVEAVSNGVSAFRDPAVKHAHRTLTGIVLILGLLLAVISYLAPIYGVGAMDQTQPGYQSVLSQLAGAIVGRGVLYFIAIGSLLAVLCLSANTSFVDFPRVCRLVARDGYLPRVFAMPGRRLVYSVGILWLAAAAGLLLTLFGGITDRLIPLFAVGAFMAFTLSQLGMSVHWLRRKGNRIRLLINGTGAAGTGGALLVILAAKLVEGAWIVVLVIPCVLALLKTINRYYEMIDRQLRDEGPIALGGPQPPIAVLLLQCWDRLADKAVRYSLLMAPDVIAIHLTKLEGPDAEEHVGRLRRQWRQDVELPAKSVGLAPPKLVISPSPYRSFAGRLLKHLAEIDAAHPGRPVLVVIPEVVKEHWWDYVLLDSSRIRRLRAAFAAPRRPKSRGRHGALGARRAASGRGHRGGGAATKRAGAGRAAARLMRLIGGLRRAPEHATDLAGRQGEGGNGGSGSIGDRDGAREPAHRPLADPGRGDLHAGPDVRRLRRQFDRDIGAGADPCLEPAWTGFLDSVRVVEHRHNGRRALGRADR